MHRTMYHLPHHETNTEKNQLRVRAKFPRARLHGIFDASGTFVAWEITDINPLAKLSGQHQDDDDAWKEAAKNV